MSSQPTILDEILSNIDRIPELPAVALQVNRLLDDPDTSAQDLARLIMMDPSLTTKVLRLCNSAEYGFVRKIATITEAVSILGYNELKRMILTIISHGFLDRPVEGYALEKGALWENALTCAIYARYIATKENFKNAELAFIAALLRDIGKIAMENYIRGRNLTLEETVKSQRCSYAEAEERIIGASHTEVGSQLAKQWNLPESLAKVISYHHTPSQIPPNTELDDIKLVCMVHLADTFTMMTGKGIGTDGLMYPLDMGIFEYLRLSPDPGSLESLYADLLSLQGEIDSISKTFEGQGKQ